MNTATRLGLLTIVVAIAGAALSVTFASKAPAADTHQDQPALTVAVTRLAHGLLPLRVSASGNIAPWQEAGIGPESDGLRLVEVLVNVGDEVHRGQVLARFAPETVQADLAQRRAAVAEAQVNWSEAAANARRARALQDTGALSVQHIQQQLSAEAAAQARLDAARAAEAAEQLRLAQTQLRAPDDGVISARDAAVGAVVPMGQAMFRLIRSHRLEWRAEVASTDLARLRGVRTVHLRLGDGEQVEGRLRQLAPLVDLQTRNGLAYVDLPRHPGAHAGMFAHGEFDLGSSPAMTLPRSAVQMRDGFAHVFRVGADSRVAQTRVTVGREAGDRVEILEGLAADARVVASGTAFLGDNDLVRIVDEGAP